MPSVLIVLYNYYRYLQQIKDDAAVYNGGVTMDVRDYSKKGTRRLCIIHNHRVTKVPYL